MSPLDFDASRKAKKRGLSKGKLLAMFGLLACVGVGSTFAANINLNSGTSIEFGQGVEQTISCAGSNDTQVMILPEAEFINTLPGESVNWVPAGGAFMLKSIEVSGIPDACLGKIFTMKLYAANDSAPSAVPGQGGLLYTDPVGDAGEYLHFGEATSGDIMRTVGDTEYTTGLTYTSGFAPDNNSFVIHFMTQYSPTASSIKRITLETKAGAAVTPIEYFGSQVSSFGQSTGGNPFSFSCSAGSVATGIFTDPAEGGGWNPYLKVRCAPVNLDYSLGTSSDELIFNGDNVHSGSIESFCSTGKALIGLVGVENYYASEIRPVCGSLPNQGSPVYFHTVAPATGYFLCPANEFVTGFVGRSGSGLDSVAAQCSAI